MAARIRGDKNQFWDNVATGAGGASAIVDVGRSVEQIVLFVTVGGATTISVEVAHPGDQTAEGIFPEGADGSSVWHPFKYANDAVIAHVFAGSGSVAIALPDVPFQHIRLKSTNNVTATAGWLGTAS
jgi:hypothetical protein